MSNESISTIMHAEQNIDLNNNIVINEGYLCPVHKL